MKGKQPALRLTNVEDGETVHQRCLLVTGDCQSMGPEDFISVKTTDAHDFELFPEQTWPVHSGHFKALVMLSPGTNIIQILHTQENEQETSLKINLQYIPLLQYPPLHLAIMVANDSPLFMDCPPQKAGGYASAHSDLSAAIEKFRMTAYMWQAVTAEDFRAKGLGRRTFRLEEEWTADTVSRNFATTRQTENRACESADTIRSTAKVTVVKSSQTKQQILSAKGPSPRLFNMFMDALAEHGGQFDPSSCPVVAGLILDTHHNERTNQTFGHVTTGCHDPSGISLGTFGSHLTYSWPRSTEEIASCLIDARMLGPKTSKNRSAIWELCAFGQSSFFSAVGLALGVDEGSQKKERQSIVAQDWRKQFMPDVTTAGSSKDTGTVSHTTMSLKDALQIQHSRHFLLPTDKRFTDKQRAAEPVAEAKFMDNERGELDVLLRISSDIGIARISFNGVPEASPSIESPTSERIYSQDELDQRFNRSQPLQLHIHGFNGKELTVDDVWATLRVKSFVRIPGSPIRLYKRSVYCDFVERNSPDQMYEWAQLLKERGPDGNLHRATSIDLRVGSWWDGGVVEYADGHKSHWGPMRTYDREHEFGGHASESITLPPHVNIRRIEVNRGNDSQNLQGIRMRLTNSTVRGELNATRDNDGNIVRLEPASHEVIVGFYGRSGRDCHYMKEFGIITVAKDVGLDGLPDAVYDLSELRNTVGMGQDEGGNDTSAEEGNE
ncbi:putative peptidase family-domain-containing protein [Boeremia exigua]|uniref:putative peptidase family-domain-containing protein n=1 Tax=Boeremia exigua TaxID=749465 RepID=UPI001E8E3CDB|nr:putative peptidase family-domain-containing protein [Boeremia exigua]KAH6639260.1 putative peptidase family-domain-containing protein [Boeremia exigua]